MTTTTKVFVHGNPEVAALWGPLFEELRARGVEQLTALSPPGFGAPVPVGFGATPAAYVKWLADELEALDGAVDLVGHDWGAGHVFGLAGERPDLIRSWAADCAGLLHPEYEWHEGARAWRSRDGEAAVAGLVELPTEDLRAAYEGLGLPAEIAGPMAEAAGPEMGTCILRLYRAADRAVLDTIRDHLAEAEHRPGLLLSAGADPYVAADLAPAVADEVRAGIADLGPVGHWWMVEDPATAADALVDFWDGLG